MLVWVVFRSLKNGKMFILRVKKFFPLNKIPMFVSVEQNNSEQTIFKSRNLLLRNANEQQCMSNVELLNRTTIRKHFKQTN